MWDDRKPDRVIRVPVEGHEIAAYSFGTGDEVLLLLNGGPGLPCDYLRDSHSWSPIAAIGWSPMTSSAAAPRTGRRIARFGPCHAMPGRSRRCAGRSAWGGSIYWASPGSLPVDRVRPDLPRQHQDPDPGRWGRRHSASGIGIASAEAGAGTRNGRHDGPARGRGDASIIPAYQAAVTILNYRHVCRLDDWPAPVKRSLDDWNMEVYGTMQGPNEFTFTGNYKDWKRLADMPGIAEPTLILCGLHDELTPACSMRMHHALPNSRIRVFRTVLTCHSSRNRRRISRSYRLPRYPSRDRDGVSAGGWTE